MSVIKDDCGSVIDGSQAMRTFFVTSSTAGGRALFQSERLAELLMEVLQHYRRSGRYRLHEFVIMTNHFHLLITPAGDVALERAMQFVKGGFSFRVKKELQINSEIWQAGFASHRIRNAEDYGSHVAYILRNPVTARLVESAELFRYSSAWAGAAVDEMPQGLKPIF